MVPPRMVHGFRSVWQFDSWFPLVCAAMSKLFITSPTAPDQQHIPLFNLQQVGAWICKGETRFYCQDKAWTGCPPSSLMPNSSKYAAFWIRICPIPLRPSPDAFMVLQLFRRHYPRKCVSQRDLRTGFRMRISISRYSCCLLCRQNLLLWNQVGNLSMYIVSGAEPWMFSYLTLKQVTSVRTEKGGTYPSKV